jgi:hypothetical protein
MNTIPTRYLSRQFGHTTWRFVLDALEEAVGGSGHQDGGVRLRASGHIRGVGSAGS